MRVELISTTDKRWSGFLGTVDHEFYHSPGYLELEANRLGGEPVAVLVSETPVEIIIPLIKRVLPTRVRPQHGHGGFDLVSPYGYAGPLFRKVGDTSESDANTAQAEVMRQLREQGVVAMFVRQNPILNQKSSFNLGVRVDHGECVWIDLQRSEHEILKQMRSRFRSYINGARRSGLVTDIETAWEYLPVFYRMYVDTMDRVGADDLYYFKKDYFHGLKSCLGEDLKLVTVSLDGIVHAAGLFAISNGIVQYLFSGTEEGMSHPHATKLMIADVRDWAHGQSKSVLHLGGGLGAQTQGGLAWFKRGFSRESLPFCTWRVVVDEQSYGDAVSRWEVQHQQQADEPSGYFPAYRKGSV